MNLKQKYAKLHTLVNDAFSKVDQALWGHGYLVTAYEEAVRFETDGFDDVEATDVEFVDISDKVDLPGNSSVDWN